MSSPELSLARLGSPVPANFACCWQAYIRAHPQGKVRYRFDCHLNRWGLGGARSVCVLNVFEYVWNVFKVNRNGWLMGLRGAP